MKKIFFIGIVILGLVSCTGSKESKKVASYDLKKLDGNYVTDGYKERSEDFDWVGVIVKQQNDSTAHIAVRSRVQQETETCSFDADATIIGKDSLESVYKGKSILYLFTDSALTITTRNPNDSDLLSSFCTGGATIAGTYKKLNGSLDIPLDK